MPVKIGIPEEPQDIKDYILRLRSRMEPSGGIDWDPLLVWAGNKIPQYLWNHWKRELSERGFTWQKFLRLLRYRTDDAILWAYDRITWESFIERIVESIDGPLGKALTTR
jgi:transposase